MSEAAMSEAAMSEAAMPEQGCELKAAPKFEARPRLVSVNGITIPRGDIARETQNHAASTPIAAWKKAARALVIRELLHQEARARSIEAEPMDDGEGRRETPEEAAMRALLEQDVIVPTADEDTCQRFYAQNMARFSSAPIYAARHILIAAAPNDIDARDAARVRIKALMTSLHDDPAAFTALAGAHSACPSAKTGGNLGQIGPGQTVPEFETALASMNEDDLALVETRYGIHLVALDQKIDGKALPFDMVRDRIADFLNETVRRRAMQQYVSILAGKAAIEGVDLVPDEPASVQKTATA